MDDEVTKFEESVLFFANAHRLHGPGSKFGLKTLIDQTPIEKLNSTGTTTPFLTPGPATPFSISSNGSKRSSFGHMVPNPLDSPLSSGDHIQIQEFTHYGETIQDNDFLRESEIHDVANNVKDLEAWQLEAASVDRSVQILPGVKRLIDSIPAGRYAVATSGTKAFGNSTYLIFS
jgi:hypothetical protein